MHLGKQQIWNTLNSASSVSSFCQSCFKLKLSTIGFYILPVIKALHIKLVTCLEHIVLSTFSAAAQSVSSLDIFSDALVSNYCISILTVLLHTVSLIMNLSIYRTNSIYSLILITQTFEGNSIAPLSPGGGCYRCITQTH